MPQLRLDYALASISCEHCRSSRNNPHYAPRNIIYYKCLKLASINEHPVLILGQITINIFGCLTTLNIICNEVPIEHDGILGTEFFRNNNAKINHAEKQLAINNQIYPFEMQETISIPARTISDFYVRIKNSEQKQGFIPQ